MKKEFYAKQPLNEKLIFYDIQGSDKLNNSVVSKLTG